MKKRRQGHRFLDVPGIQWCVNCSIQRQQFFDVFSHLRLVVWSWHFTRTALLARLTNIVQRDVCAMLELLEAHASVVDFDLSFGRERVKCTGFRLRDSALLLHHTTRVQNRS